MKATSLYIILLLLVTHQLLGQQIPSKVENIAYLVTFGKDAQTSHGDDDFYQVFFFQIPETSTTPVYIRIFDPETSGDLDEKKDEYNTETVYSVYGGKKCSTDPLLKRSNAIDDCRSGILIQSESYGNSTEHSGKWVTLGPFNPKEGEYNKFFKTYIFKCLVEGKTGDDGNIYKLFLSSNPNENIAVEGGNIYTYKYHFRLVSERKSITHLYPYVDDKVVKIKQNNFDFDNDGVIKVVSTAKNGEIVASSGDNEWVSSFLVIKNIERNTSLDYQIVKKGDWKNDMVIFLTNQYGEKLPFFSIPIGGVPKYKMGIDIIYHE